jgi:amidohydrolase
MADLEAVKDRMVAEVDRLADVLLEASHSIHEHPELGFKEHHAHEVLTAILEGEGLAVERGAYGLETAFAARAGSGGPTIAVLCEYDALPGIGHACGHNVIATAGLGAGLAAATLAEEVGGQVLILGTPAEEGGGGKVFMADAGAFEGVDAAMMVHPAGLDLRSMNAIAVQQCHVHYEGLAAHAAAAPHKGRNALDAAVLGYMNVAALRQHIRSDERIHGIFTESGDAANIVPARAGAIWYVRSPKFRGLEPLKQRVLDCLEAGTKAAGCTMTYEWLDPAYADLVDIDPYIDLYAANLARFGREVQDHRRLPGVVGSTDMGNVSYLVPSIHPMIQVSPPNVAIHTEDFVRYARGPEGDAAVLDGAKAMALTVADLWMADGALDAVKAAFEAADRRS